MEIVLITALGVGGATIIGAVIGFCFKKISHSFSDIVLSFASGVMLAASVIGLILPSLEYGGKYQIVVTIAGIFCGALCVNIMDKVVPHLHKLTGIDIESHPEKQSSINKVLLFVIAIAIHNLPEGIAAGVGFGTENVNKALLIAGGIALQNIPEGMVIIAPMVGLGIGYKRIFSIAVVTGIIEVVGTFIGYFAVTLSTAILPFALSFAGGTMLYVISDETLSETHAHGSQRGATYSLIIGFCVMLLFDTLLG